MNLIEFCYLLILHWSMLQGWSVTPVHRVRAFMTSIATKVLLNSKVRSGTCPTNKKHYCIIRRTNYTDGECEIFCFICKMLDQWIYNFLFTNSRTGSGSVLRDCSSKPSTLDFSCSSDLCNHATTTHRNKKIYFVIDIFE